MAATATTNSRKPDHHRHGIGTTRSGFQRGVCRYCGCTDGAACVAQGGCAWQDQLETVCTAGLCATTHALTPGQRVALGHLARNAGLVLVNPWRRVLWAFLNYVGPNREGLSPVSNVSSQTVAGLVDLGLMERKNGELGREEYVLTEKGRAVGERVNRAAAGKRW